MKPLDDKQLRAALDAAVAEIQAWRDAAMACGLYQSTVDVSTPAKWKAAQAAAACRLLDDFERIEHLKSLYEFHLAGPFEDGDSHVLQEVVGNINDRQWVEVGKGQNLREAIDDSRRRPAAGGPRRAGSRSRPGR